MTLLLPEGTRLLHIGPAKTGTTSLQSAFHTNREALARHGVHYAGAGRQPRAAAAAVAIGQRLAGHRDGPEAWPALVEEVRASTARRVVISSETFARAEDAGAAATIAGFGADRTHVVITMRPVVDMLASSWQQAVQTGSTVPYEPWLEQTLAWEPASGDPPPAFWRKTRFDLLARRWAGLVGADRLTVVSLAAQPRDFVLRTFEDLTGLPEGTLVPDPRSDNVSLGLGLAETVRRFNELFLELPDADKDRQAMLVEFGAVRRLRAFPEVLRADARIEVPTWAAERAATVSREMAADLRSSGVRVVGDLDALAVPSRPPVDVLAEPAVVSTEAASRLLVGMMLAAGRGMPDFGRSRADLAAVGLRHLRTRDLLAHTARRVGADLRGRLRRRGRSATQAAESAEPAE